MISVMNLLLAAPKCGQGLNIQHRTSNIEHRINYKDKPNHKLPVDCCGYGVTSPKVVVKLVVVDITI